jgi:hypothetical protein
MMERTSHLAGLWFGPAISNTSHSNKASSATIKRARFKVKAQGRRQCCHNKHKRFPYQPTRDVSLLSGHASYVIPKDGLRRPKHVGEIIMTKQIFMHEYLQLAGKNSV